MSNIEWTERTWNPVVGCTPVSPGCLNCYAATMARRLEAMGVEEYRPRIVDPKDGLDVTTIKSIHDNTMRTIRIAEVRGGRAVFTGDVRTVPDRLEVPLKRRTPTVWFVNSMSDLFHEAVPFEFIDRVFAVMALCPQHTFQVLTKRPERMAEYMNRRRVIYDGFSRKFGASKMEKSPCDDVYTIVRKHPGHERDALIWPLPNVWLGTSVENKDAMERVMALRECPATVRFLSIEPLLQDLGQIRGYLEQGIHWVIVGGESGPGARPCNVEWIRSIVRQCKAAAVPCFVKQLGAHVLCRNDDVSDWLDECNLSLDYIDVDRVEMQGDPVRVRLDDKKGGDPSEWPADLRVREMPNPNTKGKAQ